MLRLIALVHGFCFLPVLTVLISTTTSHAADFYVAPNGTPTGNGSISNPWDIATAFAHPATVKPGDTIWIRGGTYRGQINSRLQGTVSSPLVIRAYRGERVTFDASIPVPNQLTTQGFQLLGSHAIYRDLELTNSIPVSGPFMTLAKGGGFKVYGENIKLINNVIHDVHHTASAISGSDAHTYELYGNIIHDNGFLDTASSTALGHAVYLHHNETDGKAYVIDNVMLNSASYGMHVYWGDGGGGGTHYTRHFHIEGNILANSGKNNDPRFGHRSNYGAPNLFAGGRTLDDSIVINNYTYHPLNFNAMDFGDCQLYVGRVFTFQGNYCVTGTRYALNLKSNNATMNVTGNTFVLGFNGFVVNYSGSTSGQTWNSNEYYYTGNRPTTPFSREGETYKYSFTTWKSTTGFDSNSTFTVSLPTSNKIVVRPNRYEAGRANIAIYNWEASSFVNVDVSSVIARGINYEVKKATDFYGPAIASGIYNGGAISIPMNGKEFEAFVLRSNTSSSPAITLTATPQVSVTALSTSINAGQSTIIGWSATNATSCSAQGGWVSSTATSGSQSVNPSSTTTYTMNCTGPGGTNSGSATIQVTPIVSPPLGTTGNTYHVAKNGSDGNPGTSSQPFATVQQAIKKGLKPGDTVIVHEGTYPPFQTLKLRGNANAWITFKAAPGERVIIDWNAPRTGPIANASNVDRIIALNTSSHIILDGFEVTNSDPRFDALRAKLYGSTKVNRHQFVVSDATALRLINEARSAGVLKSANVDISGDKRGGGSYDIIIRNMKIYHLPDQAISALGVDRVQIINNHIYDLGFPRSGYGVYGYGDGHVYRGNVIHDTTFGLHLYGGAITNSIVENNTIYQNGGKWYHMSSSVLKRGGSGIAIYQGNNNIVRNNLSYENEGTGILISSINTKVYNNTVYKNNNGGFNEGASGQITKNNIAYLNNSGNSVINKGTLSNNLFGVDPQFKNPGTGNFRLQPSSPAINKGADLSSEGIVKDIEGNPRPMGGAFDIGAYEFGAVPQAPVVNLTANPTTINSGQAAQLQWSATNATSCSATWTSSTATSGSQSVSPSTTTTYTLSCSGSGGNQSASATVTVNTPVTPVYITLEAESGSLIAPMVVANDNGASNGKYIWAPQGAGNDSTGKASYTFNVSQAGTYRVWARVISDPIGYDDSFYVSMDNGTRTIWDTVLTTSWKWGLINARNVANPLLFNLSAGSHTLHIHQREDGTKLDKLIITNDTSFIPVDPPAPVIALTATPASIPYGGTSTLAWSSSNATSCSASWTALTATSGSQALAPTVTTPYQITCAGLGGSSVATTTINVHPMLANGDMESGSWRNGTFGSDKGSVSAIASDQVHGGQFSLKTTHTRGIYAHWDAQPITVQPHRTYTVSIWAKTENIKDAVTLNVYWKKPGGADSSRTWDSNIGGKIAGSTTGWQQLTGTVTVPGDAVTAIVHVRVISSTGGTAWLDDAIFKQ